MFQVNPLLNQALFSRQRIHMKNQALFSLKHKSKKLKCRLLQFLFGALRVNYSDTSVKLYSIINLQESIYNEPVIFVKEF